MFAHRTAWQIIWWANLLTIPLLSLTGRSLQQWLLALFSREFAAALVFIPMLLLTLSALVWLRRISPQWGWHLLWLALLFIVLPLALDRFEERIHFLLFGLFGFTSMRLYPPLSALMWVYVLAGGDELLQWLLPQRVGDWHDVYINLLAGSGGLLLAYVGKGKK
jgi:hypothetical protein